MRVGVIVAARRPVPYLSEALASVLSQEPAPDVVVLVDHGSEPPLEAVEGVQLARIAGAGGPAAARQAGLEALDADLIALADSDDVWEPGKLAAQVATLEAHPEAAACFGRAEVIDADGKATGERLPELAPGVHSVDELAPSLYVRNAIPAASAVVRRDALLAVGGFTPAKPLPAASDWDLWLRLVAAGYAFVCEPSARIRYRRHPGGLTSSIPRLAMASLMIHDEHAALVDEALVRDARASDLELLARGQIRERRYEDARASLAEAAKLRPPGRRERNLRRAAGIPGIRALLGRRNPYNKGGSGPLHR